MRLVLLSLLLLGPFLQGQERRIQPIVARKQVALVVGNGAYANNPLKNAVNDAQDMARRLRALHYDVALVTDAGRKAMGVAVDQFIGKLGTGDVAFFYYSGHGMQVEGENYLIPVDYQGKSETDIRYDTQPAGAIQERMEKSGAQLNIMVLDACRDNPFHASSRSATGGLAIMTAGRGTFIAFATSPGQTASDNPNGRNGLFTQYLLEALNVPGLGLNDVFDLVREKVDAASGGKQLPWTLSSVVGRYTFVDGGAAEPAPMNARPPTAILPPTMPVPIDPERAPAPALSRNPVQLSPPDRAVFDNYPRTTTLQWSAAIGAARYGVEIEWGDPGPNGAGNADPFAAAAWRPEKKVEQEERTYTFNFVGQQPGRWRVWAIGANGRAGPKSEWRLFRYTQ